MSTVADQPPGKVISLSELGRRLNIPVPKLLAMHEAKAFVEDYRSTSGYWFLESRLNELRKIAANWGLPKAVAANIARQKVRPVTGRNIY
jgi:hypothetical protein